MRPFVFPFSQHIGAPSVPVVQPGDRVQRGQCIAEAGEGLGSPIYASVSGMVLEVTGNAVIVRADDVQPKDYVPLTAQAPLECIRQAGIVGLGGAGFPTYQKLAVPFSHGGVVIANASECEPILNHNIDALEKDCRPMIRGLQLAMDLVHADKGVIAIKAIHGDAVRALQQAIADDDRLDLHFLPNIYPVGEERAVVREVLGTLLDAGSLPSKAGAVIINVETLQRMAEAVDAKKPLIDKDLTVAGKLNGPEVQIFHDMPLGMAVSDVLERAGGLGKEYGELIMGGPFMGKRTTLDAPIVKTTGGIIATETFLPGPEKIGLLVCACGADEKRLREMVASMGSAVAGVAFCKQAHEVKPGVRKCDNPGHCPGQVQRVMTLKKEGAQALLISNCTDCTNTVMACAPQLHLPVYHCTDGALRAVHHKLIRRIKA